PAPLWSGERIRALRDVRAVPLRKPPPAGQRYLPVGEAADARKLRLLVLERGIEIVRKMDEAGCDPLGVEVLQQLVTVDPLVGKERRIHPVARHRLVRYRERTDGTRVGEDFVVDRGVAPVRGEDALDMWQLRQADRSRNVVHVELVTHLAGFNVGAPSLSLAGVILRSTSAASIHAVFGSISGPADPSSQI